MGYEGIKTDPDITVKTINEDVRRDFDFVDDIASTETVSTIDSVTIAPVGGLTETPGGRVISGTIAQLLLTGGTEGVVYVVTCKVTTNNSQKLEQAGRVYVGKA